VVPDVTRLAVLEAVLPGLLALDAAPGGLTAEERTRFLGYAFQPPGNGAAIVGLAPDGALLERAADGTVTRRVDRPESGGTAAPA
jgi:hypothetical protein